MKVIDVLGMHITDYPLKEAIKLSLKFVSSGAMNTIFYVSSQVLLDAGDNPGQRERLQSMDLILYGEPTVLDVLGEKSRERKNEIKQDEFLREFIIWFPIRKVKLINWRSILKNCIPVYKLSADIFGRKNSRRQIWSMN